MKIECVFSAIIFIFYIYNYFYIAQIVFIIAVMKVVNITEVMIKLQFKLPQALISRGFTRRTVFHAPAFQQKGINRLMDIYQIWKHNIITHAKYFCNKLSAMQSLCAVCKIQFCCLTSKKGRRLKTCI